MTARAYDYAWRKLGWPMTFTHLHREALEVCSPDLYLRYARMMYVLRELHMNGLLQKESRRRWERIVVQGLVRAYDGN